jgi:hypothetical protein
MIFSKKPDTTKPETMLIALAGLAGNLVTILTLGHKRPSWELAMVLKVLDHKFGEIDGSDYNC